MNERQIEEKVKSAFTSDIPDNFDIILEKSIAQKEKIVKFSAVKKKRQKYMRIILSTAAAVVIVVTAGFVGTKFSHDGQDIGTSEDGFFGGTVSGGSDDFFSSSVTQNTSEQGTTDDSTQNSSQQGANDNASSDNSGNGSTSDGHAENVGDGIHRPSGIYDNDESTEKKKIGSWKAREIALKAAGLTEDQVYEDDYNDNAWWDQDFLLYPNDAASSYIIIFKTDLDEYEYSIDPYTGDVLSFKKTRKYIGFEKAKELLLQEIGKSEEEITNIEIVFYVRSYMFDVSFKDASCKAEIDAVTGKIKIIKLEEFETSNSSETESSDTSSTVLEDTEKNSQN
jgi:hypothetical protein